METTRREVQINGALSLSGVLTLPVDPRGLVLFVHGSGSGRFSTRNRFVAQRLARRGLATLLFDLLTDAEEREDMVTRALRFDIDLLGARTITAVDWAAADPDLGQHPIGLFGASTGAAAALRAAASRPDEVRAVVSRGGRPDLAGAALSRVRAPTLLIVGGNDLAVLDLNRSAARRIAGPVDLAIVPDATHLFEEPGALEHVCALATSWFLRHLAHAHVA